MRSQGALLALVFALVLALGVGWFFAGSRERQRSGAAVPAGAAPETRTQDLLLQGGSGPPAEASPDARASVAERPPEGLEPSAAVPIESSGERIEIQVRRGGSDEPVPRAELTWSPRPSESEDLPEAFTLFREGRLEEAFRDDVRSFHSDAGGSAFVPRSATGATLVASAGEQWGFTSLAKDAQGPVRLELRRDADVTVRVVGSDGEPVVGARVALRSIFGGGMHYDALTAVTAAPDGLAQLRHAGVAMQRNLGGNQSFHVAACALVEPAVQVAIDPDAVPTEPVELVLAPGGTCRVRVLDLDGQPFEPSCNVRLRIKSEAGEDSRSVFNTYSVEMSGESLDGVAGGVARFEHVALGKTLVATVTRQSSNTPHRAEGRGPRRPGEQVELVVRLGGEAVIVRGRALGADGQPLASSKIRTRIELGEGSDVADQTWSAQTDAEGRFEADVHASEEDGIERQFVVSRLDGDDEEQALARKSLPPTLRPGLLDLGDFILVEAPVIAAGTVRDDAGAPIAGAWVLPSVKESYGSSPDEFWWNPLWQFRSKSDAEGRFVLRGEARLEELSLTAQKDGFSGERVMVQNGATGVELVLGVAGTIAGKVLLDESLSRASVQIVAELIDPIVDGRYPESWSPNALDEQGAFAIRGLRPGNYTVKVVHSGSWEEVATVQDVVVGSGATARDPRLDPLDLRASLRALKIRVVDEYGAPISSGTLLRRPTESGGRSHHEQLQLQAGPAEVLFDGRPLDLVVIAPDHVTERRSGVVTDQEIVLRKGPLVRLTLAPGVEAPRSPLSLSVYLEPVEESDGLPFWITERPALDERGEVLFRSSLVGRARIVLVATLRTESSWSSTTFLGGHDNTITIFETPGEQSFPLYIDPQALEQVANSLRER